MILKNPAVYFSLFAPKYFEYNETHLLHFCNTGMGTSTHFLGLWFVRRQPRGTQFYLTTVLWSGCWVQEGLCSCPAWTWPLDHKAYPSHCNERRVNRIKFTLDKRVYRISDQIHSKAETAVLCVQKQIISVVLSARITMFTTWLTTFLKLCSVCVLIIITVICVFYGELKNTFSVYTQCHLSVPRKQLNNIITNHSRNIDMI